MVDRTEKTRTDLAGLRLPAGEGRVYLVGTQEQYLEDLAMINTDGFPDYLPTVGTTNKAVFDPVTANAAPNYTWVLWGKVGDVASDGFTLDDGSGAPISVIAPGHNLLEGDYASVRGTLVVNLPEKSAVLISQSISKYN